MIENWSVSCKCVAGLLFLCGTYSCCN